MRAREIVQQLLGFARKKPLNLKEININEVLKEVVTLTSSQARMHKVVLSEKYEDLPLTVADADQLKQVFLNVVNNAVAAMSGGGTLIISTVRVRDHALIEFRDTGSGIPKELLKRIFDLLFDKERARYRIGTFDKLPDYTGPRRQY
jgi:signal transduction histidine kinase